MSAHRPARRRLFFAAGGLTIAAAFAYLLYAGIGAGIVYFLTPSELLARGEAAYDTPVRLGGAVVPGTVSWNADALELLFRLGDGSQEIAVRSNGAPPQMFRDGIEVVVEGRYTRAGVFESSNLMVKHSNEYRAPSDGERPEELYQHLLRDGSP